MTSPELLHADDLAPIERRLLFLGLVMLCEDSGCLALPSAATLKVMILPWETLGPAEVAEHLAALVTSGRLVPYEVAGRQYAYLPDFAAWNRLTRWNAPREAPLPPWISFEPHESANRSGSGTYTWHNPAEHAHAESEEQPKSNEENRTNRSNITNEAAGSLRAACEQPAENTYDKAGF